MGTSNGIHLGQGKENFDGEAPAQGSVLCGSTPEKSRLSRALHNLFNIREGRASYATIRKRFVNGSKLNGQHLCILIVAMLIASIGLNTDSTECVIGAMLICPLMGSVLAISYGVATLDRHIVRDAVLGLLVQVVFCLATSTLYFVLSPLSNETNELLSNSTPTIWDILVALAGGFAGGLGNSRKQEPATLIAGVAVATALMPPLCAAGYGIALRDGARFLSAFYEFLLNVVFIAFAAELVLLALKVPLHRDVNDDGVVTLAEERQVEKLSRQMRVRLLVGTIIFAIPCIFMTYEAVAQSAGQGSGASGSDGDAYEAELTSKELAIICPGFEQYRVGDQTVASPDGSLGERVVAEVVVSEEPNEDVKSQVEDIIRLHVPNLDSVTFTTG